MNPVKHFKGTKSLGTFVSEEIDEQVLFGWSKYNIKKESMEGIPFIKKEGRKFAHESLELPVVINTSEGYIQKGDIKIHDYEMTNSAADFVKRMKKYFRKAPDNVTIVLGIEYLKKLVIEVHEKNEKLKSLNSRLTHENFQLMEKNIKYKNILTKLKKDISELE